MNTTRTLRLTSLIRRVLDCSNFDWWVSTGRCTSEVNLHLYQGNPMDAEKIAKIIFNEEKSVHTVVYDGMNKIFRRKDMSMATLKNHIPQRNKSQFIIQN